MSQVGGGFARFDALFENARHRLAARRTVGRRPDRNRELIDRQMKGFQYQIDSFVKGVIRAVDRK